MIGDWILKIKKIIKENMCVHDYEKQTKTSFIGIKFTKYVCKKCGRIKR